MTCIKTGARVYLTAYDRVVPADLHKVGDCIVINYNANCPFDAFSTLDATHVLHNHPGDEQWHDQANGIIVTQAWEISTVERNTK